MANSRACFPFHMTIQSQRINKRSSIFVLLA